MIEIKRRRQQAEQMPVRGAQTHADSLERHCTDDKAPIKQPALKREIRPFVNGAGVSYRTLFRDAFDYFESHYPPRRDLSYWERAAKDMGNASADHGCDEFFDGLLIKIYEELGRTMPPEEEPGP